MFWQNVCDKYYYVLTQEERTKLFDWIQKNPCFDLNNEDCKLFYDRYNPDNQYSVTTEYNNIVEFVECFYIMADTTQNLMFLLMKII